MIDSAIGSLAATQAELESVKIAGLSSGVNVDRAVIQKLGGTDALTIHEYATTGGITLVLPSDVYVNAPFDEWFSSSSPLRLAEVDESLILLLEDVAVPVVRVVPLPGYLGSVDADGNQVSATVMSHADRIRISPIVGCAYDCAFCDLASLRYERRPVEQLLASIDAAMNDEVLPTRHLLISGGTPGRSATHQQYFEDVCTAIVDHVREAASVRGEEDFGVDIMMSPQAGTPAFVERMVERGVGGFSFNIELFSDAAATLHAPLKHRLARPHLEDSLRKAVDMLGRGSGRVRSLIVIGLESAQDALDGIEWLASLGCDPVLSPFRPARDTGLASARPPTASYLQDVLSAARDIVARHDVALGPRCIPCQHNTLTFPWDVPGWRPAA